MSKLYLDILHFKMTCYSSQIRRISFIFSLWWACIIVNWIWQITLFFTWWTNLVPDLVSVAFPFGSWTKISFQNYCFDIMRIWYCSTAVQCIGSRDCWEETTKLRKIATLQKSTSPIHNTFCILSSLNYLFNC